MQGIYWIINWLNLKRYIGSAKDIEGRWKDHLKELRKNKHGNPHLQSAWNKYVPVYGEGIFVFEVIERVKGSREYAFDREQLYLDLWWDTELLYNVAQKAGGGNFGPEVNQKISEALMGHVHCEEAKQKIGYANSGEKNGMYGKYHTDEAKTKQSKAQMGHEVSEETRIKIRKGNLGKIISKETRIKQSRNTKKYYETHEGYWTGKHRTEETIRKIAQPYPAFYNTQAEEFIPPGRNLTKLCRKRGLNWGILSRIKHGITKQSRDGWRLATEEEITSYN